MSEQQPIQHHPEAEAKEWLHRFEQCARQRAYDAAKKLFHKNCVYYGLQFDDMTSDLAEMFPSQLNFSFDLSTTKFIIEGNLTMVAGMWVAQGLVHGSEQKAGRATIGLMRFKDEKVLAVHWHISRWHS